MDPSVRKVQPILWARGALLDRVVHPARLDLITVSNVVPTERIFLQTDLLARLPIPLAHADLLAQRVLSAQLARADRKARGDPRGRKDRKVHRVRA